MESDREQVSAEPQLSSLSRAIRLGFGCERNARRNDATGRTNTKEAIRTDMKKFLALCFVLAVWGIPAFAQDSRCQLPLSRTADARTAKVPPDLPEQVLKRASKSMEFSADEQRKILEDARKSKDGASGLFCAQTVRLNRTTDRQLFVYFPSFCMSQNCPVWIYRRTANGYELLLEDVMVGEYNAGFPSSAVILGTWTNGYRDIRLDQHISAFETGITILKFNGSRYRARVCMFEKCVNGTKGCKYNTHKCDAP